MTCRDCIHYEVCDYHITEMTHMTVNECPHSFKNKANFVEVVRCKDCKFNGTEYCIYDPTVAKDDDDFCSCGTPKERGGEE